MARLNSATERPSTDLEPTRSVSFTESIVPQLRIPYDVKVPDLLILTVTIHLCASIIPGVQIRRCRDKFVGNKLQIIDCMLHSTNFMLHTTECKVYIVIY